MKARFLLLPLMLGGLALSSLHGQSPAPVILQPANTTAAAPAPTRPAPAADDAATTKNMVQLLQQMQATNAETIKKQEATLEMLDGLQKAADDIKIFSKRG